MLEKAKDAGVLFVRSILFSYFPYSALGFLSFRSFS